MVAGAALALPRPALGAPAAAEWQPTGLAERAWRLFAPASGAFFAQTAAGLLRSDDGGASWRPVNLPPGLPTGQASERWHAGSVAVDPNDHTRLYVGGWASTDDAATWSPLVEQASDPRASIQPRVSAADSSLIYLSVVTGGSGLRDVSLLRSRDGGTTWETFLKLDQSDFAPGAGISVTVLSPHPTDPNVLFQSVVGFRGRGNQGVLRRSEDQGQTFKEVLYRAVKVPRAVIGGKGAAPGRFYAALSSDETGSLLMKSDDHGVTWTEAGAFGSNAEPIEIGGLAYDPASPDRVWVGLDRHGVRASEDGGQTWTEVSPADWDVSALAFGVDAANLYAATAAGLFRLPLR